MSSSMRMPLSPSSPKSSTAPYVLGLTGGMAAGKSTLARMLSAMGALVWDADAAAKHLYKADHGLRKKVLEQFGHALAIVDGQGQHIDIDRPQLAAKVFADPDSLRWLERQVHPAVAQAFETWKVRQPMDAPYLVREAAILFETGGDRSCHSVATVEAPQDVRLARAVARGSTHEDAQLRMDQQWTSDMREAQADWCIHNDGGHPLLPQAHHLHCAVLEEAIKHRRAH